MNVSLDRIYDKDVLEMVTVATELCVRLENLQTEELKTFCPDMLKILPLLYVKSLLVVENGVTESYADAEMLVTEDDYNFVRSSVAGVMGSYDDYLDVFVEEMKYSDRPVRKTISEDLADIYQDLRNFVGVYKDGVAEAMEAALSHVTESFSTYWGGRVLSAVRALHEIRFNSSDSDN